MPLETLFSNPLPTISPSRSLITRLTSPLAKRNRNIAEFSIEPDHPYKVYAPGESVTGHVLLNVAKGFDITHLVVCLHGYAKVYKNQIVPGEGVLASKPIDIRPGNQDVEYLGHGTLSLFQDEIALCGDGFLKKSIYKFGFELQFPARSLPSSIDFERGTVSYSISATLTRPTTIVPTVSCHRRVTFQDSIDIGHIPAPKPRVISLEPISKRGRIKVKVRPSSLEKTRDENVRVQISRTNTDSSTSSNQRQQPMGPSPESPAPSEETAVSQTSNSTRSFQVISQSAPGDTGSGKSSEGRSSMLSVSSQTITARTELQKQGALPGDTIPIKVSVTHTKPNVRGLVIVTLYRQGRVDMHPPIPLVSKGKNKNAEFEEMYPRSRSGLGGLSFSNGSPSSVFRKDLSQSTAMMIINPDTLAADIKSSINLPDTAFPTMANVPGGMISFKYFVEVVVDLCGKLGEPRFLPRLTSTEPSFIDGADNTSQLNSDWANHILDTVQLRRTRSVVDFTFQVIVGTKDSVRAAQKVAEESYRNHSIENDGYLGEQYQEQEQYNENGEYYQNWGPYEGQDDLVHGAPQEQQHWPPPTHLVPPPPPEEPLDEKAMLRREEALLLPSQPPEEEGQSSAVAEAMAPSAPLEADLHDHNGPPIIRVAPSPMSTRSVDTVVHLAGSSIGLQALEAADGQDTGDDKQELERQRLLAQASAPLDEDDGTADGADGQQSAVAQYTPSAPVLTEEDEYNAHTLNHDHDHAASEHLPQYWR